MKVAICLLAFLACNCHAVTIKATGVVRARIVAPEVVEVNLDNYTVVYTETGATAQIVF